MSTEHQIREPSDYPEHKQLGLILTNSGVWELCYWDTGYSIYGAGGHWVTCNGCGQIGAPLELVGWVPVEREPLETLRKRIK